MPIMYVMQTKLTLRMDEELIHQAKRAADRRGKSVSQMVAEFFATLGERPTRSGAYPPITTSLLGVMEGKTADERAYQRHLREKYL